MLQGDKNIPLGLVAEEIEGLRVELGTSSSSIDAFVKKEVLET